MFDTSLIQTVKSFALNSLGAFLSAYQRSNALGKYWFYQRVKVRFGKFLIPHKVPTGVFSVPLDQWCFWLNRGPENYYLDDFIPFVNEINKLSGEVLFVDLGADIGIASLLATCHCPGLSEIIAIEPNKNAFKTLEKNLNHFPIKTTALCAAVSDSIGKARLICQEQLGSDHEGRIISDHNGDIEVTTVDAQLASSKAVPSNIVLKIDVEGEELNVLEGCKNTLSSSIALIILIEIHPDTLIMAKSTPEDLFSKAECFRDFSWFVPTVHGLQLIDRSKPFFKQFDKKQYDVIGIAAPI